MEAKLNTDAYNQTSPNVLDRLKPEQAIRLAKKKIKEGSFEDAKGIYKDILVKFPKNKKAIDGIKTLSGGSIAHVSKNQEPPQDQQQHLVNLYQHGQLQQILDKAKQWMSQFPNSVTLHSMCGAAHTGLGHIEAAIESYKSALNINPSYAEAHNNLGKLYYNMGIGQQIRGESEAAIGNFKKSLKIVPNHAQSYLNMGNAQKSKGDLEAAIGSYKQALHLKSDYMDAYYNLAVLLQEKGNLKDAIDNYESAVKLNPDYAEAYNNMGTALSEQGDIDAAIDSFERSLSIKPDYAEAYNNMGCSLHDKGSTEAAIDSFERALHIKPDYAEAYSNLGGVLEAKGAKAAAIESYKKALQLNPNYAEVHRDLSTLTKYDERTQHVVHMQNILQENILTEDQRCHLSFALAKVFEDLDDLDQSFYYLELGNLLRKNQLNYNIKKDFKLFDQLKNTYPFLKKSIPQRIEVSNGPTPIFILGMTRSGTSLVEQIVSSHSMVAGAGELDYVAKMGGDYALGLTKFSPEALLEFRKRYLDALVKHSNGKSIVTDKMPENFKYIGLILSVFPEAKIVHLKRNPAATCWSNYKHYFPTKGLGHCYELDDLVTYYGLYQKLMQFWQEQFGNRIYNLDYDSLTINQDHETRKLIQHLGLEWQSDCLSPQDNKRSVRTASLQQVRKKVYQGSSQKWQKFEPYLNGVFDQLDKYY